MTQERDIGIESELVHELLELVTLTPFAEDHQVRRTYCADPRKSMDQRRVIFLYGQTPHGKDERHVGIGNPRVIDGFRGTASNVRTDYGIIDGCDAIVRQTGETLHVARNTLGDCNNMISPRINNTERPAAQ